MGQSQPHGWRQLAEHGLEGLADFLGVGAVQLDQKRHARQAVHQGAYRRAAERALDQVTLPVPRLQAQVGRAGPLLDGHHVLQPREALAFGLAGLAATRPCCS